MGYMRSLYIAYTFEIDRTGAEVVEHTYTITDQDRGDVDSNFVHEPGLDSLLQDTWCTNHDILISRGLLRLSNGTFHTVGDKGEWRTFLHPFLWDVVSDNECR